MTMCIGTCKAQTTVFDFKCVVTETIPTIGPADFTSQDVTFVYSASSGVPGSSEYVFTTAIDDNEHQHRFTYINNILTAYTELDVPEIAISISTIEDWNSFITKIKTSGSGEVSVGN